MDQNKTGQFIMECRKEKKLTQKQLAEQLNISDRSVSKWECGKSFPDISLLIPLSKIFDVSISELIQGEKNSNLSKQEQEDILTLSWKKENVKQKRNKVILLFILTVFFLVILFLGTYFILKTLTIQTYTLEGCGENYCLTPGTLVYTNNKISYTFGTIISKNQTNSEESIVYALYLKDDPENKEYFSFLQQFKGIAQKQKYTTRFKSIRDLENLFNHFMVSVEREFDSKPNQVLETFPLVTTPTLSNTNIFYPMDEITDAFY